MPLSSSDRFLGRVESYAKYRPSYPAAAIDLLEARCGLKPGTAAVDFGSGTGILAALLLKRGARVFGIEPNREMRAYADLMLGGEFRSEGFDRALRVHDFGDIGAGKLKLHGEGFCKAPRIALGDARAAARADLDLDDAERLERAQRIAGDDARHAALIGDVLLAAEEIARFQSFLE